MKRSELSKEDQALLATDFGDLDKIAAEQVKVAGEMYTAGAEMALSTADEMDKLAAASSTSESLTDGADDSEKVAAADYGNIIAEGFIDKLASLGEERHGDPMHYFIPYMEDKVAAAGAGAALGKFFKSMKGKATDAASGVKDFAKRVKSETAEAVAGKTKRGRELSAMERLKKGRYALGAGGAAAGAGGAALMAGRSRPSDQ